MATSTYRDPGLDRDVCDNHSTVCPSPACDCPDCRATEQARQDEANTPALPCAYCQRPVAGVWFLCALCGHREVPRG